MPLPPFGISAHLGPLEFSIPAAPPPPDEVHGLSNRFAPLPVDVAAPDPAPAGDPVPHHLYFAELPDPLGPILRHDYWRPARLAAARAKAAPPALPAWVLRRRVILAAIGFRLEPIDPVSAASLAEDAEVRRLAADLWTWVVVGAVAIALAIVAAVVAGIGLFALFDLYATILSRLLTQLP